MKRHALAPVFFRRHSDHMDEPKPRISRKSLGERVCIHLSSLAQIVAQFERKVLLP